MQLLVVIVFLLMAMAKRISHNIRLFVHIT